MDRHDEPRHVPVMGQEVVDLLAPVGGGLILDATFGGGGHTRLLLAAIPDARILALDRDPAVVPRAQALGERVEVRVANFGRLAEVAGDLGPTPLAGALFDLGLSTLQLDDPERGLSYRQPGPLDMRLGPDAPRTAHEVVNEYPRAELARIIRRFGEERFAGRIAAAIEAARPIEDTSRLAEVVSAAVPASARRHRHPARRTFQALRIHVNDELGALERGLDAAVALLRPGGRLVVISYHSLEDRLVKKRLRKGAGMVEQDRRLPEQEAEVVELRLLTRRPKRPTPREVATNRRARSARLRAAEKLPPTSGDAA